MGPPMAPSPMKPKAVNPTAPAPALPSCPNGLVRRASPVAPAPEPLLSGLAIGRIRAGFRERAASPVGLLFDPHAVMAGLVPAIHTAAAAMVPREMPGTSPGMTEEGRPGTTI